MIDFSSEFGQRAQRRLNEERIIWLTTTGLDSTPQPRPVWFLWDGVSFLIFSRPETAKLRHIRHNPRVALHLDGDRQGGDIIILTGVARIESDPQPADQVEAYVIKYQAGLKRIGMDRQGFASSYSVAIRVLPDRLRGH